MTSARAPDWSQRSPTALLFGADVHADISGSFLLTMAVIIVVCRIFIIICMAEHCRMVILPSTPISSLFPPFPAVSTQVERRHTFGWSIIIGWRAFYFPKPPSSSSLKCK